MSPLSMAVLASRSCTSTEGMPSGITIRRWIERPDVSVAMCCDQPSVGTKAYSPGLDRAAAARRAAPAG
jgi:hypothetical protein